MSERNEKIAESLEFLTPEELKGLLQGTLEALEEIAPGYVDHLVLGILSIRAGFKPGKFYGENDEDQ